MRAELLASVAALWLLPLSRPLVPPGTGSPSRAPQGNAAQDGAAQAAETLRAELERSGIRLDLALGVVAIPVTVDVRGDLLEYLLVGPAGAAHESLFVTRVRPSLLNVALLALGATPGRNARWDLEGQGLGDQRILPPEGDGFFLYVAWREDRELFFFRVEDLIANLASGRSMRRERWVYLGSRMVRPAPQQEEAFAADLQQNLINLTFFYQGNTLLTAALPECVDQTIWIGNSWILPPRDSPVLFLLARAPLAALPAGWEDSLPRVAPRSGVAEAEDDGD
jgi:hypothetical protein